MRPVVVRPVGFEVAPVYVVASSASTVDTLTVNGVIHSSLFAALDKSGAVGLPREARAELAFSLADIFEYRVDMSKDLQEGDKFHVLVERLQKPNGAIIINKILGARLALSGNDEHLRRAQASRPRNLAPAQGHRLCSLDGHSCKIDRRRRGDLRGPQGRLR